MSRKEPHSHKNGERRRFSTLSSFGGMLAASGQTALNRSDEMPTNRCRSVRGFMTYVYVAGHPADYLLT
jgi:hypothetical protein